MTDRAMLYRVQAADGRGPWRPGLSKYWIDMESDRPLYPDVFSAFGAAWREQIPYRWHAGCACRSLSNLLDWFTPVERGRLMTMGYTPVLIDADKIIVENEHQVVFARRTPLSRDVILLPWEIQGVAA